MTSKKNILIVEDDENLAYLLSEHLLNENFNPIVCHSGVKALKKFESDRIDLCILDIVMPDLDGIRLAKEIRKLSTQVPIVFLTSRNLKSDHQLAYNIGADDYLTKPFDADLLVLKIQAILNRCYGSEKDKPMQLEKNGIVLDLSLRKLISQNSQTKLSKTECGILEQLYSSNGQPVPRDKVMKQVWGKSDFFISKSLDVYITRIRKILKEHTDLNLETIRDVGYVLS